MAYFIFNKSNNFLYKIFLDNTALNNSHEFNENDYVIKEVSISNFNDVKLGKKEVRLENNNIIYTDHSLLPNFGIQSESSLKQNIEYYLEAIDNFLSRKKNHPEYLIWENFYITILNYKKNNFLLLNNINYPLNMTFLQFLESKGHTTLNTLQLP